jgi:hypothetical protein
MVPASPGWHPNQWFLVGAVAAALKSEEALQATIPNKEKKQWLTSITS